MLSCSIHSWQIDAETVETVRDFIFWGGGSKITAVIAAKKVMTNLDSILKSRDITLPTKVHLVKAMAFPGVMYGYENCTIKKAEHQRICFQTVVLEKTLESPLDCKSVSVHPKGNQP